MGNFTNTLQTMWAVVTLGMKAFVMTKQSRNIVLNIIMLSININFELWLSLENSFIVRLSNNLFLTTVTVYPRSFVKKLQRSYWLKDKDRITIHRNESTSHRPYINNC